MQNSANAGEAMRHCKRAAARSSRVIALGVLGICDRKYVNLIISQHHEQKYTYCLKKGFTTLEEKSVA
jgi:hypothetical protein